MERRAYLAAAAGLAGTLTAGCVGGGGGGGDDRVAETTEVAMTASQFEPRNIHAPSGATVSWTNDDSTAHTVTSASDNWSFDA